MKNLFYLIIGTTLLISCKKENTNNQETTVSKWKLVEQLMDPGDGSGVFTPVISNKIITFYDDDTFTSNGDVCSLNTETENESNGKYLETEGALSIKNCNLHLSVQIEEPYMIISYPCIEGCSHKYEKIE